MISGMYPKGSTTEKIPLAIRGDRLSGFGRK